MKKIRIGTSDMVVSPLGIGTMSWGQSKMWGYGANLGYKDVQEVFKASVDGGVTFFDTAEIYGNGRSERNLGRLLREASQPVYVATKFAPLPWRLTGSAVSQALDKSLARLGLERVDLYQLHFPVEFPSFEKQWDGLVHVVKSGKARYIGVSNYGAEQMRRAYEFLAKRGVELVANQVEYSLLHRSPEVDGLLHACREMDITLIAYSPLGRGALSGKYKPGRIPSDLRRSLGQFKHDQLTRLMPLISTLQEIGEAHGGKTPAQVTLNWLMRQANVLVIPGAKNVGHIQSSLGALGWELSPNEAERIDEMSADFKSTVAYRPFR